MCDEEKAACGLVMNNFISHLAQLTFLWKKLKTMPAIAVYLIILLNSINSKGDIQLRANKHQTVNCDKKTVLRCNISSSMKFNILKIKWGKHEEHFECDPISNKISPGFECTYTMEALTLTILHPKPANMGRYFCTIQTNSGHDHGEISVSLGGECPGEFSHQMAGSNQVQCSFNGIYPEGTINWFHYDSNVTSYSTITSLKNSDGTFNITSVLKPQLNLHRYNCSLWLLKNGQYLKNKQFEVSDEMSSRLLSRMSRQHCPPWTLLIGLMFSFRTFLFY